MSMLPNEQHLLAESFVDASSPWAAAQEPPSSTTSTTTTQQSSSTFSLSELDALYTCRQCLMPLKLDVSLLDVDRAILEDSNFNGLASISFRIDVLQPIFFI